ncbi:acyl-CoA dehydrogenase family protein [Actinomadura flavalba]|uniref:acyl-CoA dehydrogenase family protein n=1 Tax=Actinomadura flavalba TaxID=1120938 RepID=UPI00036C88E9|nr:acyl-CoA dehydrogenase family protein [Actinomadura flavalba]
MSAFAGTLDLPFYDDRHRDLAAAATAWCAERADLWEETRAAPPDKAAARLLRALGDGGWLRSADPDDGTADLRSVCVLREVMAHADDLADHTYAVQFLASLPIRRYGTAAQRERYLPAMARGDLAGAFAVSEDGAGSDVAAVALRAERTDDGGYVLDGHKTWIAQGTVADVVCVIARTGEGPGALGLTAFLVPADTPGLRAEPIDFIAPRSFARLEFTGCRVPADAVLGRPGGGFVVAMDVLEQVRMTVGAAAAGLARRALEAALEHARAREIYGGRLFDVPAVRTSLADLDVRLSAAALLVGRAAWEADRGGRGVGARSAAAKLYATEAAQEIVDGAVQVFGAAGLVPGAVTERLYRQVRSLRIYEGTSEVLRSTIADTLPRPRNKERRP